MKDLAILTCCDAEAQQSIDAEDQPVLERLRAKINLDYIDWQADFNPAQYRNVLIRTTWNYYLNLPEFLARLETIAQQTNLINPFDTVRWNSDKKYLQDIAQHFKVVPTLNYDARKPLQSYFEHFDCETLVLKPRVSAGSYQTHVLHKEKNQETTLRAAACSQSPFLIQPFLPEIAEGELSFIFLNGKLSHTVNKVPQKDEFRSQPEFGSNLQSIEAGAQLESNAADIVSRFASDCFHARVDGVIQKTQFLLMELELIEPSLFLLDENYIEGYCEQLISFLK